MGRQWDRYLELAESRSAADEDRFQAAGTYANWLMPDSCTDEEWAEAFWNAWHNDEGAR